uniref:RNA polymerase subunit alpha n=1 Tax=Chlorobotrys sp. TaxID=2859677 RepID=UPI00218249F3|nr:RNA polymerase subunit alpha [Chlorobotrys sp.]UVI60788.1 RNA polymerase subunit alpha [Chlorobotrys sp.]
MKIEKRKLIVEIEKRIIDKRTGHISFQFRIGPLKKTMATTVGSALRRTLLSMTKTVAITSICGNFKEGNCIREDLFELSLNLQRVHIKSSFSRYIGVGRIFKKGPGIITAKDLKLEEGIEVVNPYQYICTVNESYSFNASVMINSPGSNQNNDYIDPLNPLNFIKKNYLKEKESQLVSFFNPSESYFQTKHFKNIERNSKISKNYIYDSLLSKSVKYNKHEKSTNVLKDSKIKVGTPQKLPIDIVVVDPIYSALQSCGFEVVQTTNSSVGEYDELIKRGVSETEEFLRFVIVSRGAIEPAIAVEAAVQELKETLSIIEPLPHIFATEKNLLLSLERKGNLTTTVQEREKILNSYILEIIKKLDIKHLKLPQNLELFLRREGFVSFNNLIYVPLEFLKRIGLNQSDIKIIEKSINSFGLSLNISKNLRWQLLPNSLPF